MKNPLPAIFSPLFLLIGVHFVKFTTPTQAAEKPNIILIMCDDLGWGDVGFNGGIHIRTPHLDKMAAN